MVMRRLVSRLPKLVLVGVIGMVAVGCATFVGINFAVDRAVTVDAEQKAAGWAAYFIEAIPDLDGLLLTGELTEEQKGLVSTAEKLGDVFRFKLFDKAGGVVLVSDEAIYNAESVTSREHSATAASVAATGASNIALKDGTGKVNRPLLYVEAYVPVIGDGGEVRGIVEVYIDQTRTAALFRTTFATMAVVLAIGVALAFGLPMTGFLLRSNQAREAKKRVEFLAHHDPLTGLLNRTRFTEQLSAKLADPARANRLAVVFFDVDDFKTINDKHGHEAGDEFLKHVARALAAFRSPGDIVARAGGDELTMAVTGQDGAGVIKLVDAVVRAVREPVTIRGRTIFGKISAGIYLVQKGDLTNDAIHRADVALYQAKVDGGNTYRVFTADMEAAMQERQTLEQLIRDATSSRTFELHFQPLLHAKTKACAGFEALLRLPDGKGGFVPPVRFIPIAESMGLIIEIGNWVLERATATAATWPAHLFVSVNLSVKQFADQKLVPHVADCLTSSGLRPQQLELEVTESMLMENTESVAAQLKALKDLGVSIAMDDFGTGYSSLGYLWQFQFDKIKVDRSFLQGIGQQDHQAREILDTIIMLGHKLGMTVTAEGVETENQADVLNGLSCDHFQGFLYGRPGPAADIAPFLLANTHGRQVESLLESQLKIA